MNSELGCCRDRLRPFDFKSLEVVRKANRPSAFLHHTGFSGLSLENEAEWDKPIN